MPFEKGHSGNISGRKKGALNKKTELWNSLSTKFVDIHTGRIDEYLDELWGTNKTKFVELYVSLIGYHRPKMKAIENKTDNTGNIIIDLGGGLTEPIINKNETPFERIRRVNNLEPEKKEAYDRLTTTGEILPSDFTHGVKFYDTPKEDPSKEAPDKKQKKDVKINKPSEDNNKPSDTDTTGNTNISSDKNRYGNYIVM